MWAQFERKTAAENEISLALKEVQVLCNATFETMSYLRNIEFSSNHTEIGLRAVVFEKVVKLENLYDTYCTLFRDMDVTMHQLSNRISQREHSDQNYFVDVMEYVDSDYD